MNPGGEGELRLEAQTIRGNAVGAEHGWQAPPRKGIYRLRVDCQHPLPIRRTPWHMAERLQDGRVDSGYLHESCARVCFFRNPMNAVARLRRKRGNAIGREEPHEVNSGSSDEQIFQSFWFRITQQ